MSHRNSQKSQKFSLRFLSAARAEGTFRDFLRPSGSKRAELERRGGLGDGSLTHTKQATTWMPAIERQLRLLSNQDS